MRRRETIEQKASRLLRAGRIRIVRADTRMMEARVQGDNGFYRTIVWRGAYSCSCPYPHRTSRKECSHAKALRKIWQPVEILKKAS